MKESEISDSQILEEVKDILSDHRLRRCRQCTHSSADGTRCTQLKIPISPYQYAGECKHYITNEELVIQQTREALKLHEKEERKINHLLTMCLNSLDASMLFLEDFANRVETEYKRAEARELAHLVLRYFDVAYLNKDNADAVIDLMKKMDSCGVMEESDFNHYNFRR